MNIYVKIPDTFSKPNPAMDALTYITVMQKKELHDNYM